MNLHTIFVMKLKEKTDLKKHHATVLKKLDGLLKDPIFIDTIHGEQELSLDQTIELFNGIRSHFVAPDSPESKEPGFETNSFDVS